MHERAHGGHACRKMLNATNDGRRLDRKNARRKFFRKRATSCGGRRREAFPLFTRRISFRAPPPPLQPTATTTTTITSHSIRAPRRRRPRFSAARGSADPTSFVVKLYLCRGDIFANSSPGVRRVSVLEILHRFKIEFRSF